uniref:CAS family C-terminal domain-containing protein n=1 Tax=Romanomermis culicivorax TaxID=13658 RepID=A0A915I0Y2_ROMCU
SYDLLPRRTSPVAATLSRPRKSINGLQQQLPHRVRFAVDCDANNAAHSHPSTVIGSVARQVSSSDAEDRSSSVTLTSNSADSSFSNSSNSTTANDALLQTKSDNFYDVPRPILTSSNRYDVSRTGKDENSQINSNANQKFHGLVDNSLIASVYDAPLATIQLPVPSKSTNTQLQKSQQNRKSPFDDYDFVDVISKNGTKNGKNSTSIDDDNNFYREKLEILSFYVPQVDSQMESLNRAIDDFLSSVESNSPPRDFVAKSRFVVLSAHKLVYLGDSLSHCLKNLSTDDRDRSSVDKLSSSCDRLCEALKSCVTSTKRACSTFPCVEDVQTMVDSMVRISNDAHEFKLSVALLARR